MRLRRPRVLMAGMNYSGIIGSDIANGAGVRVSLFVSGCTHHCRGCFNESTWDFAAGRPFTSATEDFLLAQLDHPWVAGLSLLGGEPMEPANQRVLAPFLRRVRERLPGKSVWCWTGCVYERDLAPSATGSRWRTEVTDAFLAEIDVLVDGPFVLDLKDISLKFRGSSNQRILARGADGVFAHAPHLEKR